MKPAYAKPPLTPIKSFAEHHALLPKGVKLAAEDVFSRQLHCSPRAFLIPLFKDKPRSV